MLTRLGDKFSSKFSAKNYTDQNKCAAVCFVYTYCPNHVPEPTVIQNKNRFYMMNGRSLHHPLSDPKFGDTNKTINVRPSVT